MFRIQKLLLSEFQDIYEPIVVENPFTQVDEHGNGLRQYHIALTVSKIIFGCDDFDLVSLEDVHYNNADPEIETFQLVSLMPLQFVKLKFYRRQNREIMQLSICGDEERPMYFEFGGHLYKNLMWNTWRERVATIRMMDPQLSNLTNASPFSSTDVIGDEEIFTAVVHTRPESLNSVCMSCSGSF